MAVESISSETIVRIDLSSVPNGSVGSFVVNQSSASDGDTCAASFSDAIHHSDHRYRLFSDITNTWEEAKTYAESLGGHLAIIDDEDENTELFNYMTLQGYRNAYFGLSDAESEGVWTWINGAVLENGSLNTHWGYDSVNGVDEPNGSIYENYGMFYELTESYKWNDGDFNPDYPRPFIVEWDADEDTVVGSVSRDRVYSARSDLARQSIAVNDNWLVNASDLDDAVTIVGSGSTIDAGGGNDVITFDSGGSGTIVYADGDGDDTVYNFSSDTTTIRFASGISTASVASGEDLIINANGSSVGSITIKDYYSTETMYKKIELVYIVDTSGSMSQYAVKIRDTATLFTNYLVEQNVEFNLGLVEYDTKTSIKAYAFTSDADSFIDNINRVINNSFNDNQGAEYGLTAITDTANGALSLNFDSDADKYFVVITDEGYTENVSYSDTVIASLRAADIQVDVLGMPLSRASSHNDELECQPEWEPIATSTGGEFYDIAGNYYPTLKKIVLNTTDGKAVVVDLNLVSGSETGCFVLDDDTSMIAKFNHSTVEGDTVVGFVNSDHVYEAVGDSTRQKITIPDRWKVTATDKKDELNINGSNATVSGSNGKDYISFSSNTQIVMLTDLDVSEDELTFDNRVEPGSLTSTVENGQLTFSSSGLTFTLADQSNLSSDIRNYTVHNAGSDNTIHELLYGDSHTHVVELTTWNYGFTPNNSIISLTSLNNLDDDQTPTDFATLLADGSSSSLWGGFEGDDTLIGTDGRDEFFYLKGNGRDVIENASDDDLINLLNIGLEDISSLDVRADSITIGFNDGGSLRVNSSADIGFRLSDGSTWHAVERGTSNTHWEAKS